MAQLNWRELISINCIILWFWTLQEKAKLLLMQKAMESAGLLFL